MSNILGGVKGTLVYLVPFTFSYTSQYAYLYIYMQISIVYINLITLDF